MLSDCCFVFVALMFCACWFECVAWLFVVYSLLVVCCVVCGVGCVLFVDRCLLFVVRWLFVVIVVCCLWCLCLWFVG